MAKQNEGGRIVDVRTLEHVIRQIAVELETKYDWNMVDAMDEGDPQTVAEDPGLMAPGEHFYDVAMKHLRPLLEGRVTATAESSDAIRGMASELRKAGERMQSEADQLDQIASETPNSSAEE